VLRGFRSYIPSYFHFLDAPNRRSSGGLRTRLPAHAGDSGWPGCYTAGIGPRAKRFGRRQRSGQQPGCGCRRFGGSHENTETKTSRGATTNASGDFDFATVQPGNYELRVTKTGFSAFVRTGFAVTPDKIARVDEVLNVGNVSETVTVAANAVMLQTDSAEVRHDLGM
jgi:Carboxypeptidase regulatory-like domain